MSWKRKAVWLAVQAPFWVIGGYCRYAFLVPQNEEYILYYGIGEAMSAIVILLSYWKMIRWAGIVNVGIVIAGVYLFIDAMLWPVPIMNNPRAFNQGNVIQLILGFGLLLIWLGELGRGSEENERENERGEK